MVKRDLNFNLLKLDSEGESIRDGLVNYAVDLLEREHVIVLEFTDNNLIDFALEWQEVSSETTLRAKKLLAKKVDGETTGLIWLYEHYSLERLYCLYEFSIYCNWISSKEIIQHFGDLLRVFLALQGNQPKWCDIPYHLLLQIGYAELWKRYRSTYIREWLESHWKEVVEHFEMGNGHLDGLSILPGVEYHHIYTQYKQLRKLRRFRECRA